MWHEHSITSSIPRQETHDLFRQRRYHQLNLRNYLQTTQIVIVLDWRQSPNGTSQCTDYIFLPCETANQGNGGTKQWTLLLLFMFGWHQFSEKENLRPNPTWVITGKQVPRREQSCIHRSNSETYKKNSSIQPIYVRSAKRLLHTKITSTF